MDGHPCPPTGFEPTMPASERPLGSASSVSSSVWGQWLRTCRLGVGSVECEWWLLCSSRGRKKYEKPYSVYPPPGRESNLRQSEYKADVLTTALWWPLMEFGPPYSFRRAVNGTGTTGSRMVVWTECMWQAERFTFLHMRTLLLGVVHSQEKESCAKSGPGVNGRACFHGLSISISVSWGNMVK